MDLTSPLKILIADDHPVVRQGLVNVIESNSDYSVIDQCNNGEEALEKLEELKPDICILDISMPKLNGLQTIERYREKKQKQSVEFIILTMYDNEEYFEEAMALGVKGYLLKDNALTAINHCIYSVSNGNTHICPELSGYLLNRNNKQKQLQNENPELDNLTPTEKEILKNIAQNKTSREIADALCISYRTVQNHRNNITTKLELKGYNKLLEFALDNKNLL